MQGRPWRLPHDAKPPSVERWLSYLGAPNALSNHRGYSFRCRHLARKKTTMLIGCKLFACRITASVLLSESVHASARGGEGGDRCYAFGPRTHPSDGSFMAPRTQASACYDRGGSAGILRNATGVVESAWLSVTSRRKARIVSNARALHRLRGTAYLRKREWSA